jgi:hypothetical protein
MVKQTTGASRAAGGERAVQRLADAKALVAEQEFVASWGGVGLATCPACGTGVAVS